MQLLCHTIDNTIKQVYTVLNGFNVWSLYLISVSTILCILCFTSIDYCIVKFDETFSKCGDRSVLFLNYYR